MWIGDYNGTCAILPLAGDSWAENIKKQFKPEPSDIIRIRTDAIHLKPNGWFRILNFIPVLHLIIDKPNVNTSPHAKMKYSCQEI